MTQSSSLAVSRRPRVPLHALPITLWPQIEGTPIAANGLNLGIGGLSLHSPNVPDIGTQMQCEFRDPETAQDVWALAEVVWTQEAGPYQGEFGLRFLGLSQEEQSLISHMIQHGDREFASNEFVRDSLLDVEAEELGAEDTIPDAVYFEDANVPAAAIAWRVWAQRAVHYARVATTACVHAAQGTGHHVIPASSMAWNWLVLHFQAFYRAIAQRMPVIGRAIQSRGAHLLRFSKKLRTRPRIQIQYAESPSKVKPRALRRQQASGEARNMKRPGFWKPGKQTLILLALVGMSTLSVAMVAKGRRGTPEATPQEPSTEQTSASKPAIAKPVATKAVKAVKPEAADPAPANPQNDQELADFSELFDKTFFGSQVVEQPLSFVVKMSEPVTRLQGVATEQGFTVTIPNSLALTDASVISKGHPLVDYAAVINYGDYSRLTVKFVHGVRPEYRVRATGPNLEIAISNPAS